MNDRASKEVMAVADGNNAMKLLVEMISEVLSSVVLLVVMTTWLLGFVFAHGFWSTLFCWFPFYAWYLDLERLAQILHWI